MYDPTIHVKTLSRHLRAQDFYDDPQLFNTVYKSAMLDRAVAYASQGFPPTSLKRNTLRGKYVYGFTDLAEALVIRHITRSIRRITSVKQDDRSFIVSCIKSLTSEGIPYRVYKFDISSFYESVDVSYIISRLAGDIAFSGQSVRALESFFSRLLAKGIVGLPRGLALSATLAEYLMRDFDQVLSNTKDVWYYARFVDDILVITNENADPAGFLQTAAAALPTGLVFNRNKSRSYQLTPFKKGNAADPEATFDFLGYEFEVTRAWRNANNKIVRTVRIDLAEGKVRKIKSRVSAAFLSYSRDASFTDLRDRLRILSSNVIYIDQRTGVRRPSGLHFNYPLVSQNSSKGMRCLDEFLRKIVMSPHPKNRLYPHGLTTSQRRELAGLTFAAGFSKRRFFNVPFGRLLDLTSAWAYV